MNSRVDEGLAREPPSPQVVDEPGADERDALHDRVDDPEAGARQQVVGEGVAREALEHDDLPQNQADDPVELTGPAEGPGEEDPAHVERTAARKIRAAQWCA